jgi:hypothetical protein
MEFSGIFLAVKKRLDSEVLTQLITFVDKLVEFPEEKGKK